MRRYGWIAGALVIVILLVVTEMTIISSAAGYEMKEKVVFAVKDIEQDTVITQEMLEVREVPAGSVHRDAVRSIEEAVNMRAASLIYGGEMLLKRRLTKESVNEIAVLDKSKRLFCVQLETDQANAWQLKKGQYVDIIYVPNHGLQDAAAPEATGVLSVHPAGNGVKLLKSVRIAGLVDEDGQAADSAKSDDLPKYVLFEVTGEQAVFLAYAKRYGRLELSSIPDGG